MRYYNGVCKNCGEDCDGEFCSWLCEEEYREGYEGYLYHQHKDDGVADD